MQPQDAYRYTTIVLAIWGLVSPLVGIWFGHFLITSSQQRQWVRKRKLEEFRELRLALADYFTEEIAEESSGRAQDEGVQKKLEDLKTALFRVMRSRLFIAHDVERLDVEGRWQDALGLFQKAPDVKVFVAAYDVIDQKIVEAATRRPSRFSLKRGTTMNLMEGMRRFALLLGAAGAILGGFTSYMELQALLNQRALHNNFEQLANSDVVQQARKSIEVSASGPSQNPEPDKFDFSAVEVCPIDTADLSGCYTEVSKGGIKTIHWSKDSGRDLVIESIETEGSQTLYPTPAPSAWMYLLIALFPMLGFFIPWGATRAIGWVGAGFTASSR